MIIRKLADKLITSPSVDCVYLKSYTLETQCTLRWQIS